MERISAHLITQSPIVLAQLISITIFRISITPAFAQAIVKCLRFGSVSTLATLRELRALPVQLFPQLTGEVIRLTVTCHDDKHAANPDLD